ncbi:MAG: Hsp20/alpha crystallin family protein [Deltaproteobacteria bacterium]|nr:Hsp20/alpha crystallin family protein [Deltaproteobacteria bacterium]
MSEKIRAADAAPKASLGLTTLAAIQRYFFREDNMKIFRRFSGPHFLDNIWEFGRMRDHMDHFMRAMGDGFKGFRENYTGVYPLVNLSEDDDNLYFTAELPGVAPEDLEVSVKSDTLSIKGEKKAPERPEEAFFFRRERVYGTFSRSIALSSPVDSDRAEASYKNGVLAIAIPKAPAPKGHSLAIKTE